MKTALITGASRGIGEAAAYQLAKEYDCVAIMSRNTDGKLNTVANQIHTTTNCECIPFTGDVSDFAFVEDCVRSLATSGHPVDTLVNNAGISLVGLFQHGRILNISSVWGLVGASCEVAYSATKGAINSLTMALAKELAPSHIAVNAIAFGAVDTTMNAHLSVEEKKTLCEEIPAEKMAAPEEAAACISHILAMPDYMTGEILKFDGGWI